VHRITLSHEQAAKCVFPFRRSKRCETRPRTPAVAPAVVAWNFEGMAHADFVCQKRLCDGWLQLDQANYLLFGECVSPCAGCRSVRTTDSESVALGCKPRLPTHHVRRNRWPIDPRRLDQFPSLPIVCCTSLAPTEVLHGLVETHNSAQTRACHK
jgi:hypothetical protein